MNNEGNIEILEEESSNNLDDVLKNKIGNNDSLNDVIAKNAKNSSPVEEQPTLKKKSFLDKLKPKIKLPTKEFVLNPETDNVRTEKKLMYEYIARDKDGEIIKDYFDAYSVAEVNAYLVSEGYKVYSIKTSK